MEPTNTIHRLESFIDTGSNVHKENPNNLLRKKAQLIREITSKILPSTTQNSLVPFKLVKHITSNHLEQFIRRGTEKFRIASTNDKTFTTSCVNSVFALSLLFLGKSEAKRSIPLLKMRTEYTLAVLLPSGKTWPIKVSDLLDGLTPKGSTEDTKKEDASHDNTVSDFLEGVPTEENPPEDTKKEDPLLHDFSAKIIPIIEKASKKESDKKAISVLKRAFKTLKYDFNYRTISQLRCEILTNNKKISDKKSCIYSIAITSPRESNLDEESFEHVFMIEQFFNQKDEKIYFRIYQSWVNQGTLADEIKKRGYGENEEGCMSEKEIEQFLTNFESLYCKNTKNKPNISSVDCFGYAGRETNEELFSFDGERFAGVSVRYVAHEFDPEKCVENLAEVIISNQKFEAEFLKKKEIKKGFCDFCFPKISGIPCTII